MTTQESLFSVKLITNGEGTVQPELFYQDRLENLDSHKISEITTYFKEIKTQLHSLQYKVAENEVHYEVKNMSGWVQITVRGNDLNAVQKKFDELALKYPTQSPKQK
jgi:hypothetical protein